MNRKRQFKQYGRRSTDGKDLRAEDLDLIERFETAFNAVHKRLSALVGAKDGTPLPEAVTRYAGGRPHWAQDGEFLRQIGRLRNALVHERTHPRDYLAVPAPAIVARLERIRAELTDPPRAIPVFRRKVVTLAGDTALRNVLSLIATHDFSQFPVFERGLFTGLLTENGITRWLAHHTIRGAAAVTVEGVVAKQLLNDEEVSRNVEFVNAAMPVADIRSLFSQRELLEAVLITQDGAASRRLLGIATRWDVAALH